MHSGKKEEVVVAAKSRKKKVRGESASQAKYQTKRVPDRRD
jgi:hypothetical protein